MLVLLLMSILAFGQDSTETKSYTEAHFVKMQQHYLQDSEMVESMKLKAMAGNSNANEFLKFLHLSYDEASEQYGGAVVNTVIETYIESTALLNRFDDLNEQMDEVNIQPIREGPRIKLTPAQYRNHAQYIWNEMVPSSGQASVVPGEMLRAVEKLRDEAQRNANANFHEGCHAKLIHYLTEQLTDPNIFDAETIKTILIDLHRLEQEEQPYTGDEIYDRLSYRVVDWYLYYGGITAHNNDPELQC